MHYRAFFSYARADDRIANWLHRQLDGYRTPRALVGTEGELGPVPAKLHPIFRDRTDLESGGHVDTALQQALEDSETLIVLCTPTSAKSRWVNHEVETFLNGGREAMIFPVIAAGLPDSGDPDTECFPPALRGKGLLAADLREIKLPTGQLIGDGREGGRLKLIAGLLGVKLDALVQRERRRQRQVVAALGAAALVFAGVAALAGVQTIAERTQRARADDKTLEAERNLEVANDNAKKERVARKLAEQRTGERDAKTREAIANLREAERQEGFASDNAKKARSTLHRFFATQSWAQRKAGNYVVAARYALAGMQIAREHRVSYRSALSSVLYETGVSLPPLLHEGAIDAASFSPDGKRLVTAGADQAVKLWNVESGQLAFVLPGRSASFSLDGRQIVTVDRNGTVKVWRSTDGRQLYSLPTRRTGGLSNATLSPDGTLIATAGGTAKIWSTPDGALVATLNGHDDYVSRASFSPNGLSVVTSSADNTAKVWRATDGQPLFTLAGHSAYVTDARFSSDGHYILTQSFDNSAKVWDAESGQPVATLAGHSLEVNRAVFSPDNTLVATASRDGLGKIWTIDGRLIATLVGHAEGLNSIAFSADGKLIVTASSDRTAKVWDAANGRNLATLSGHTGALSDAFFASDGHHIVTTSYDRSARIWGGTIGHAALTTLGGHTRELSDATFSPDGRRIVTSGWDGKAIVWNAETRAPIATFSGEGPREYVRSDGARVVEVFNPHAAFSFDGARLATADKNVANIWDLRSNQLMRTYSSSAAEILSVAFSPDNANVVLGSADGTATVWNVAGGGAQTLSRNRSAIVRAVYSPDGQLIATASRDGTAAVWRARDRQVLFTVSHTGRANAVAFSPDGSQLATAGDDKTAKLWSAANGTPLLTLVGHDSRVNGVAFSPDGTRVVTAGGDDTVKVWDAEEGQLLATVARSDYEIQSAVFSPDGTQILTAGLDRTAQTWEVSRLTRSWDSLAQEACTLLLGPRDRYFSQAEIDGDPLLTAEWRADRDVCEGVLGVPSIAELRQRAGLSAVAER